ncbi:MAG: GNAT family N-acetyltransferase [Bacteroidota bacterium]
MEIKIQEIGYQDTLQIRHEAMWPDKALAYVRLPNDEMGRHYALFLQNQLISVISLFKEGRSMQFRKFATLPEFQGKGYGTALLRYIIQLAEGEEIDRIWCNARIQKSSYYLRFGLRETQERFEKGGIHFVIMEKYLPKKGESSFTG